jgi:branched-chain amino acid transport system substrate-binding protein
MTTSVSWRRLRICGLIGIVPVAALLTGTATRAAEPIKIGTSMALTGSLAGTGKAALLATQMWIEDVNARRGLLGRRTKLIRLR